MRSHLRLASILAVALTASCGANANYISTNAPLGRVVIYRNGVAFYERTAAVDDGKLIVKVPRDRVDDFLKSLTVTDTVTKTPLPVTIPRKQALDGEYLTMTLQSGKHRRANVLLTYVTESPAWKPSYRIVIGKKGKLLLESWAVVDNTSGEDWKGVRVGVGASSALSFRYDLWSVRTIDRETLAEKEQFAVAPPTGLSPYAAAPTVAAGGAGGVPTVSANGGVELSEDEIRRQSGDTAGVSYAGSSSVENTYYVDGKGTAPSGVIEGKVTDVGSGQPLIGVTVVVESAALGGNQVAITDESGTYTFRSLPPGEYVATFYYNDATVRRTGIQVGQGKKVPVYQKLNMSPGGEAIAIVDTAPSIDPTSTTQGITLSNDYVQNIPVGRTFEGTLGSAAGSQSDGFDQQQGPTPADGARKIAGLVSQLKGNHNDVLVEAHAEAGIPGADGRARDRANVVRNQLIDAGVAPSRIQVAYQIAGGEREGVRLEVVAPSRAVEDAHGDPSAITTDDTPVGESHFINNKPMDVAAGSSAMVSMLRKETTGGEVYLYDPISDRGNTRYAFKAVQIDNPTDDTLEPGPVTVYGDAKFIGEGLADSIPPREIGVIPFALDRQIVIDADTDDADQISKLVTLERGVLTAEVQHLRTTHLTITSRLHHKTRLYIRHRVEAGWVLDKAPDTASRAGDAYLFSIDIDGGATAEVEISEATPMQRTLQLASPTALGMLEVYVSSPRPDETLKDKLTDLLATHRSIGDTVDRIETLRDQLAEYRQRSNELEGQLITLKSVKTGGELMRVLKQKMAEMSERVQKGTIDLVDQQEALLIHKTEFANQLAELRLKDALTTGGGAKAAMKE